MAITTTTLLGTPVEGFTTEQSRARNVTIQSCLNGYIVYVGCQTLVFEDKEKMLKELSRYLDKPQEVEREYLSYYGV